MNIPDIKVGIMAGERILFKLEGEFLLENFSVIITGLCKAERSDIGIRIESSGKEFHCHDSILIRPVNPSLARFCISEVLIGINFHWERREDQIFKGSIALISDLDKVQLINVIDIEEYLLSVISSEMNATSSLEFLKAHAVISRSWLIAQILKNQLLHNQLNKYNSSFRDNEELTCWYDREDHRDFDVCADDHCQRYQGISRSTSPVILKAVKETMGKVLHYNGTICDARFSKCCGGRTELFENTWEPVTHPYLQTFPDKDSGFEMIDSDLTNEKKAQDWILSSPEAFCNTSDKNVLKQVLNDYDLETNDFFRWKISYSQHQISKLIHKKSGLNFGSILDLVPIKRGPSGRIIKLKIVGTLKTLTIGKELEIRKVLSETHLYSSAFIIDKIEKNGNILFTISGAGWGHGVGLCQIGAAVMGDRGYSFSEILSHYFRDATLKKIY